MNRAEAFLGTSLESRYRLDVVATEAPDFFVFHGQDTKTRAPIIIRMARALRGMSIEELVDAFDAFAVEAEQLRQLSNASSHVERLIASGQVDGPAPDRERIAYCVFAHVDGVPLSQEKPPAPQPLSRVLAMLEPVATALATAHDLGVFHGDVRPDNMIVVKDAERTTLKLVRFTRATRLGSATRTFSPAYGAPEHFRRASKDTGIGPPTDTYGLALCIVELVTGQPPLIGSSPNELYKQATDIAKRPTLRARGATVSQEVEAVITRAVAVNPKLRWPTTRDFWAALVSVSSPVSSDAEPISSSSPLAATPISSASILSATPLGLDELAGAAAAVSGKPPPLPLALLPLPPPPPSSPGLGLPPPPSSSVDPLPAIPPPPGSSPNLVPPPPTPTRVPMSLKPPSLSSAEASGGGGGGGGAGADGAREAQNEGPKPKRLKVLLVATIGLAMLGVGILIIGSVFDRSSTTGSGSNVVSSQTSSGATNANASATRSAAASITSLGGSGSIASSPHANASASASAPVIARGPVPEGMVRVPAGTFTMGRDTEGKGDRPAHHVVLTHAFYIDKTEVTIDAYSACIDQGSCTPRIVHLRKNPAGAWGCNLDKDHGSYPANCVDRKQAAAYCTFAKKRLPSEAEWEYAARGTDERDYPWGSNVPTSCTLAVLSGMLGACGDRKGSSPVASAPDGVSPFGALDMGGNVWEWVADDYAPYPADEVTDPLVTINDEVNPPRGILRGGSWDYGPQSAKTTYRLPFISEAGNASIGIRCALTEP